MHDPILDGPLCAATVTLHIRWRRLPQAYGNLLRRLEPGGVSLLLRDLRTWPVAEPAPGYTWQVGSPVAGLTHDHYDMLPDAPLRYAELGGEPALEPQLRDLAVDAGHDAFRALYRDPATLSACVADLYREHLRPAGPGCGEYAVIETGRLLDPDGVLERGVVPYWCESAARETVAAAEWWLAGSEPFEQLAVLPEPPGTPGGAHAELRQWRSVAAFGRQGGDVDRLAAGRYPRLPVARSNALRVTAGLAEPGLAVPPMRPDEVLASLSRKGAQLGMFVG